MCTLFPKISKISYSQSNIQSNLSPEIKHNDYLSTCPPYFYYILFYYNYYFLTICYVSVLFLFPRLYQL